MTTPTVEEIYEEDIYEKLDFDEGSRKASILRSYLEAYGNARYEEGVKAERERMRAEVMGILDIQHSGVRQDTYFEKGYTTAYKNMATYLSDK